VTGAATGIFTGLVAGTYTVTVTDLNGCTKTTANITVSNPPVVTASAAVTSNYNGSQISCSGSSDGIITVTAGGGTGALSYLLVELPGNVTGAVSGVFTGLPAGTYTVTVTDVNGCSKTTLPVTITAPTPVVAAMAVTSDYNGSQISCNGASDGRLTVTASGGTGVLKYVLDQIPLNISGLNTGIFTGVPAGTYTVTVTDKNNCTAVTAPVTITQPPAILLSANITSNYNGSMVSCNGSSDGVITASASGGTGVLTYTILQMPGNLTGAASGIFTGLPAGTYTIRVYDINNCQVTAPNLVIVNPPAITATGAVTSNYNGSHVTCFGSSDGMITITAAGGTGALSYVLDQIPANVTGAASGIFTGVPAGNYTVTVTDLNGCTKVTPNITVNNPPAVTASAVVTSNYNGSQISCSGVSDGRITVTSSGGTGARTYLLVEIPGNVTGAASGIFTGLPAGTYTVTVTDVNGCNMTTAPVTITAPASVIAAAAVTSNYFGSQLSCFGASDGRVTVTASGGTGVLAYTLVEIPANVTGAVSGVFTGLPAGTYTFTVTDKNLCSTVTLPVTITPPPALTIAVNIISNYNGRNISCFGASDGRAEAVVTGGTGSYSYIWYSDPAMTIPIGQLTSTAINLVAGDYFVKVTDINGCMISGSVILTQPTALDATITAQANVLCYGNNTGSVTVTATAGTGTAPYQYSIDGGGTWQAGGTFGTLAASSYTVLVKDVNSCIKTVTVLITQPTQLLAAITAQTNVSCFGGNDGQVTVTPNAGAGTAPYTFSRDGGANWQGTGLFAGLAAGTYNIIVRDANLCTVTIPVVISEPTVLTMTKTPDVLLNCYDDMTATATFYASGGTLPYSFNVSVNTTGGTPAVPGFNSQSVFGAGAGTITVIVTDGKGCTATATVNITEPPLLTPGSIGTNQVICSADNPATLTELTPATGGPAARVFQWQYSNVAGGPFINIAGANASTYTPPAGATMTLYYRRMVTSGLCVPVYSNEVEIIVNPRPVGILTGGETICPGATSILKVNLPLGTGPFTLDIENYPGLTVNNYTSDADILVSPLVTTTYKLLRIRDANGCQVTFPSPNMIGSATVTVRALPAITVQPVAKITCEFGMVTYNVTATGSDLTYQWYVNDGGGPVAISDGGVYFGAQTPALMIFGATRDMNSYIYGVTVTGCATDVSSANVSLTVNTAPEILLQPKDSTICQGANATFAIGAQGTNLVYQWQRFSGGTWNNVTDVAPFSGSATPVLSVTGAPGTLNNAMFRVRITGTCGVPTYSNFVFLRVNAPPAVTLQPVAKAVCQNGGPVFFTANGNGLIDSLRWQVSINGGGTWNDIYDNAIYSGTTSQQLTLINVPVTYNTYQYRLGLKAYCTTTYTNGAVLTVNSNPVVNFAAVTPVPACGGVPKVLNGNPSGGSGTYSQHTWTGDVGPLNNYFIQQPTFNSQIAGMYNLVYRVKDSNGCSAEDTMRVSVDAPDATFTSDVYFGCTTLPVQFTKDMTGYTKFWWNFGDGSPIDSVNANPLHPFTNVTAGSIEYRDVELKVMSAGGCFDTYKSSITIYPAVDATFTANRTVVCSGGTITFTTLPGASNYLWDYGDGTSSPGQNVITHQYTNAGPAPAVLTVTLTTTSFYGCTNSSTITVTVMPVPTPAFTAAWASQIFNAAGNPNTFTNTTNPGTWNWNWRFGDGGTSTAISPSHTYTGIGTFDVWLVVDNGNCKDSIRHQVSVTPIPPVPSFDDPPSGCAPLYVVINNTSQNVATPGITYTWDFGDGSPLRHEKNPTYTYFSPGTYRITLTIQDSYGVPYQTSQVVDAFASPKAYFQVTPATVYVNDEAVRCFNLSQGGNWYVWDFGDGDTSRSVDPYHKYMEQGVYDITLHAYSYDDVTGVTCTDSWTLSPGVTVEPPGVIRFASVFTPNKTGETEPDVDNIPASEMDNYFYPPIKEEVLDYKLQIFNRWGTLIFQSNDIRVPWNGYYKHKLCKQGVYVWYVEGKYANGKPFRKTGDITLLH
jgi:PKD repeat protein